MESIMPLFKVKYRVKFYLPKSSLDLFGYSKFLGFILYHHQERIRFPIAHQAVQRYKINIYKITYRSNIHNIAKQISELSTYLRRCIHRLSLSDTPSFLTGIYF